MVYRTWREVEESITRRDLWENVDIIEGCLCDTYVIWHKTWVEVWLERCLNEWCSINTLHKYKKPPAWLIQALEENGNDCL